MIVLKDLAINPAALASLHKTEKDGTPQIKCWFNNGGSFVVHYETAEQRDADFDRACAEFCGGHQE